MSREDLNQIQFKLKSAIQTHQVLVGKLKKDPKSLEIQQQLRSTQAELTALNERQKQIVIQLRKQVVGNKPSNNEQTKPLQHSKQLPQHAQQTTVIKENANSKVNRSSIDVKGTVTVSNEPQISPRQGGHRTSIMQIGTQRGCVLRIHNDVPVAPLQTPTETKDLRGILRSAMEAKNLTVEEKQKIEYMASLNLITPDRLKAIRGRRSERKRRSTATPQFSYVHGHLPPERKRSYTSDDPPLDRRRGRVQRTTPSSSPQPTSSTLARDEESCAVCRRTGQLFSCDTCNRLYHHTCLSMASRPPVSWSCPKCQPASGKQPDISNGPTDAMVVESYLQQKKQKEKEKQNLEEAKKSLINRQKELEDQAKHLSATITQQVQEKSELLQDNQEAEDQLNKLKEFIKSLKS